MQKIQINQSRRRRHRSIPIALLAAGVIGLLSVSLLAQNQNPGQSQNPRKTVWDHIYSKEQAARGKLVYDNRCSSCHSEDLTGVSDEGPSLRDDRFWQSWGEDSLNAIFSTMSTRMPRDAPGSLGEKAYLEILSYVLEVNGYPTGPNDLTADVVRVTRVEHKDGPGPMPDSALVQVVGCLQQAADKSWTLAKTSHPIRTRTSTPSTDVAELKGRPYGDRTYGLTFLAVTPDAHKDRKVEARGLMVMSRNHLTVTSLQTVAPSCE